LASDQTIILTGIGANKDCPIQLRRISYRDQETGKQYLKIKSFVGISKNAVMTQIWIAFCVYLLIGFIKFQAKIKKSMQQILRLLQLSLFEKRGIMALLRGDPLFNKFKSDKQLTLF
jgi:hypothetical protein